MSPPKLNASLSKSRQPQHVSLPKMKDTRPRFLGGTHNSKVKGVSEVREYLDKTSQF